jgi:uncharacterized protein YbgA (DUF1722 family)/uncharacterized protein YbbK (DUF523 family)
MNDPATRSGDTGEPEPGTGPKVRLGTSACLMGERVRFDGGHKQDRYLIHTLGRYVEWVHVCPEVEVGMPIPRPTIRLEGVLEDPRLVDPKNGTDWTAQMKEWSQERLEGLAELDLHGFVLKKGSPSCGLHRVRVYPDNGAPPERKGRGVFAAALVERMPLLPVEEEGRLSDPRLRENFIERIFAYQRWMRLLRDEPTPKALVAFHSRQKFAYLAHSPQHYRELGRIVADAGKTPWDELVTAYGAKMMECLSRMATPGKHRNVLEHLMGFLKEHIDAGDKAELGDTITQYRRGLLPLVVPLTLLRHHLRRHPVKDWAVEQSYLNPYPRELMLRNHV